VRSCSSSDSLFCLSRVASITVEKLEEYTDLIKNATDDLEEHLQRIDERLETALGRNMPSLDAAEIQDVQEERLSTQKCLQICAQLSEHINQIDLRPMEHSESSSVVSESVSERLTSEGIQQVKTSLNQTKTKLERHMQDLVDQLMEKSKRQMSEDEVADITRLQDEMKTARLCLDICSEADHRVRENVSTIDNHAEGDETVQILVSTKEKTIHGKNRSYGVRIRQVGGHLNDESVQQLSRDLASISLPTARTGSPTMQEDKPFDPKEGVEKGASPGFERYGRGVTLKSPGLK
jgi:hypothetical protein